MERFEEKKITTWHTFWPKLEKIIFSQKKKNAFRIFQETKLSYISGNVNPKKLLIFQKVTFRARKEKRTHS